jgi:NB-ARC domain
VTNLPRGWDTGNRLPGEGSSRLKVKNKAVTLLLEFDQVEEALKEVAHQRPEKRHEVAAVRSFPVPPKAAAGTVPEHDTAPHNFAPPLPTVHVGLRGLDDFCASLTKANSPSLAGITGPPGIGKTTFAAAATRSAQIQRRFERICWLGLEGFPLEPVLIPEEGIARAPILALQKQLHTQLGGSAPFKPDDWREGLALLADQASKMLSYAGCGVAVGPPQGPAIARLGPPLSLVATLGKVISKYSHLNWSW